MAEQRGNKFKLEGTNHEQGKNIIIEMIFTVFISLLEISKMNQLSFKFFFSHIPILSYDNKFLYTLLTMTV